MASRDGARGRAPPLGEHTDGLLEALGVGAAEQQRLHAAKVTEASAAERAGEQARSARVVPLQALVQQGSPLRIDPDYRRRVRATLDAAR